MAGPGGKVMHAELQIGDSRFMIGDEFPGMSVAPAPSTLHSSSLFVYTEDVDTTFNRALKAGARSDMAPATWFWGDRYGKFTDPFGHQWGVATHVEDVCSSEMQGAAPKNGPSKPPRQPVSPLIRKLQIHCPPSTTAGSLFLQAILCSVC